MFDRSMVSQFGGAVRRFPSANQGNIAVHFGVALLSLLGFMGAAIDYSRANNTLGDADSFARNGSTDRFSPVTSATQIVATFNSIGNSLSTLRRAIILRKSANTKKARPLRPGL